MFVAARRQQEDHAPVLRVVHPAESPDVELDHLRSVFEDSPIAMSVASLDWRLLRVNQAHCDLLGYSEHDLLTTDFRTRIYPDDLGVNDELRADLFAGRIRSYSTERRYIHRDGQIVWCIVTVSLIRNADGDPVYFVGQMHDITERRQMEEALRASERLLSQVLESSLDGIIIVNRQGRVVRLSAAVERMTGYPSSTLLGHRCDSLPWDLRNSAGDHLSTDDQPIGCVFSTRVTISALNVRIHRPDESIVYATIDVVPLWGADGEFDGIVVTIHDVTERTMMEHQLERFALHDALTGLPNRRLFSERAEKAYAAFVTAHQPFGILFVDLNDFKPVNDRLGHAAGDVVLAEVARRLLESVPSDATVARMGGDEFAVLLSGMADVDELRHVERGILNCACLPYAVAGTTLSLGVSVGGSISSHDDASLGDVLRRADDAMYRFKHHQRLALEHDKSRSNPYRRSFQLT